MTTASRTTAMLAARAKDSQDKRDRALAAVKALEAAGTPVTATAVATVAGVSTWLIYADGVREQVQAARQRQAQLDPSPGPAHARAGREPVTHDSLRTDLAVAREQIRQLRTERDKLRGRLRLQLGAEIDGPERAELITRVAGLEETARRLAIERDARATEAGHAQQRIRELEDELTAARESLRQVIRQTNK
jgi:chromosome segregation ATPase